MDYELFDAFQSGNVDSMNIDGNADEEEGSVSSNRKLTSKVWHDFQKLNTGVAECKHCAKKLSCKPGSGTNHLKNHLKRHCPVLKRARSLQSTPKSGDGNATTANVSMFSQETSRLDFTRMVIKHNYPFNMCEHEFFEIFCHGLNPNFKLVSRNTLRADIIQHQEELKVMLYNYLEELKSKVTLTTDMWTSDHQNFGYMCLTAHFVDESWHLKKKILNFRKIDYPHDGDTLFRVISDLIMSWNLDKKLCAIVVDNATSNDFMVKRLKTWLVDSSCLSLGGSLFHIRCSAHILNLVVQDGLKVIEGTLNKIRETVKYLDRSPAGQQKFDLAVNQLKFRGIKKVPLDVCNRWNSTYLMLDAALSLREAFSRFVSLDKKYKHNPSFEEWEVAQVIKECLELFYDATCHFSGSNYPTANIFFPDICEIRIHLTKWENSEHECLRTMAIPMKAKFEKYWNECSLLLAIAVVLDPRFKMDLVEYYYITIYADDATMHVERVRRAIFELFNEYRRERVPSHFNKDNTFDNMLSTSSKVDKLSDFDTWRMRNPPLLLNAKSELEVYLEESVFPRDENFKILHWWKINSVKYPILAAMACDILASPATTVASESAFSVGGRVIDETRASLLPDIVEALVTASDWIESKKKNNVEDVMEYVERT